jgi:hypothetical protein
MRWILIVPAAVLAVIVLTATALAAAAAIVYPLSLPVR